MLNLLAQARLQANLSPGERALLKIVKGLLVSAVIAGFVAVLPVLSSQNVAAINWMAVLSVFGASAIKTLYDGMSKYFSAFGDAPLPTSTDGAADTGA